MSSKRAGPFLLLAALELAVFAPFAWRMGFYHDDWINLERLHDAGSLWGGIKYYAGLVLERPAESLQYPLLFALGGLHPLPYQLFYLAAEILEGWLIFVLLSRLTKSETLALLSSALILIFPTHAITHLWLSSSAMIVTVDLTLASLILHLRWVEKKKKSDLAWSQFLYLFGVLNYEIAAFLPLMLFGGLLARDLAEKRKSSLKILIVEFLPYAGSLALALAWQRAVVSLILHRNPRAVGFSAAHAVRAYEAGFECATNRVVDVVHRMTPVAWEGLGSSAVLGALLLSVAAFWVWSSRTDAGRTARAARWSALGAAVGAFLGAVAPFAASADYMPMVFGVMSRTNGVIALSGGIFWACGLDFLASRSRTAAGVVLAVIVGGMALGDWGNSLQWARAWTLQQDIVGQLVPRTKDLPSPAMILLSDAPDTIEPGGALAFGAHWDIGPALRLSTGRKDIAADVVWPQTRFAKDGVELRPGIRYDYPVYLYSYANGSLEKLTGPR
jgi:hypothetical protein